MNRPTLSTIKSKTKTHLPKIVAVTTAVVGVAAAVAYFNLNKKSPPLDTYVSDIAVGPVLVLEGVSDNIYTDMDYPGVMYEVNIVS